MPSLICHIPRSFYSKIETNLIIEFHLKISVDLVEKWRRSWSNFNEVLFYEGVRELLQGARGI